MMKKLLILSVLVLCAVAAAAQYTAVLPKSIAVVSDDCYDVCKRDCVYVQKMTSEQCAKICGEKCQQSADVARVQQPQQSCEGSCREYATKPAMSSTIGSGFDMKLFIRCMREKCRQDCESSCRTVYRAAAYDCIQKECVKQEAPPATCEDQCKIVLSECEKRAPMMTAAIDCKALYGQCMGDRCGKPESCEGRCAMDIRLKCKDRNLDEQTCALNIQACVRERCKPEKPDCPPNCEDKCVDGYYRCAKIAKTMTSQAGQPEDVQADYLMRCQRKTFECLDGCRPDEVTEVPQRCEDRCVKLGSECQEAGIDAESCKMKVDDCIQQCQPRFEPGNAVAAPKMQKVDEVSEKPPSPEELAGLNPQPEPPKPQDMAGLNPQPEPPSRGFWGRLWGSIFGD